MANDDHKGVGAGRPSVNALTRGLAILRCFDRPRIDLTVSEIARQTGLSQPTAWRLCATLIDAGYLVRGPNGTSLRIGAPALSLGYAAINGMDLPSIALPYMQEVAERTGGTVNLSQRRGYEIISVEQCNGEFILPYRPVGWCATLPSAASGLAVLAVLPEADLARTLEELEQRDPAAWARRRARIDEAITQYRREGAVSQAALMGGLYAAVAVPLIESEGSQRRYWALGCGGLSSRWDETQLHAAALALKRIVAVLQPAAAALPGAVAEG